MFKEVFDGPRRLVQHSNAPLAVERARYLKHLKDRGYSRLTVASMAADLLRIVRWLGMERPGLVTPQQIDAAAHRGGLLIDQPRSPRRRFVQLARNWLRSCGLLVEKPEEPTPFAELIEDFSSWMAEARGISAGTIKRRALYLTAFLRWLHARRRRFAEIRIADVDDYLVSASKRWCRRTMATQASDLRCFFRHAGLRGWCPPAMADAIEPPRIYEHEVLPASPTWEQVRQLLEGIPSRRPVDFRDRATFMLLAVYGLRASEVAALRLDDVDWDHDQIKIRRPKCRDAKICPLVPAVGNALIEYLKKGRPRPRRPELFLQLVAPFRPMSPRALGQAVRRRVEKLKLPFSRKGPHSLRHACATHLLSEGFSIKEIGDHLGHLSPKSAQIYAKVDLAGLRAVGNFEIGGLL